MLQIRKWKEKMRYHALAAAIACLKQIIPTNCFFSRKHCQYSMGRYLANNINVIHSCATARDSNTIPY